MTQHLSAKGKDITMATEPTRKDILKKKRGCGKLS